MLASDRATTSKQREKEERGFERFCPPKIRSVGDDERHVPNHGSGLTNLLYSSGLRRFVQELKTLFEFLFKKRWHGGFELLKINPFESWNDDIGDG